ncbi:MAG TPA: tRNA uridine-5-carboxymethylaminomethyl(34) synthesis GTPase MnmE [Deltaproteobacteria bacterium]|nr:tRNA uridine-5-carboxymethylaminomethyl(34) synthesis GTPase MnmE [Deltaproteobacteria bacterium]HQB37774.1 tRNA uridine-5-carboxymethylaminomethyl(34) synthesis GTPase MnmE [Deltaproteobacteria bacterium]
MYIRDTIAAISTPSGNGGIGIIRVSGDLASTIGDLVFKPLNNGGLVSHRFYFGCIVDNSCGEPLDEAMAVIMKAPHSYTREDVLELHCHGGMLVVERVLDLVLRHGARLAEPGEFTRRAFLNGRIDLVQAEAVMDIISSQTDAALRLAQHQREGLLSQRISEARHALVRALALVEAYIDFPDEDIGDTDLVLICSSAEHAGTIISELLSNYDDGYTLREGISVLIIGKPNAGKSSLLNRLLNENRAIVTHIPGTTRDIIEEAVNICGLPVRLLDTAGIRHTDDVIEQEGINRALKKVPIADLVLFVLDWSRPFDAEDRLIETSISGSRCILVLNKTDLPHVLELPRSLDNFPRVDISANNGVGLDHLRDAIRSCFLHTADIDKRDFVTISRARHRDALFTANQSLLRFNTGIRSGVELELLAVELRDALASVGTVTGECSNDEILDEIFSSFCIGK